MLEYAQWADMYLQQANVIAIYIKELKRQSESEQSMLQSRIYTCYQMYLECKHTGVFLRRRAQVQRCLQKEREGKVHGKTSITFGCIDGKHTWSTAVSISESRKKGYGISAHD